MVIVIVVIVVVVVVIVVVVISSTVVIVVVVVAAGAVAATAAAVAAMVVVLVVAVVVVVVVVVTGQLYQIIYSNVLYYPVMYVVPLGTLASLNISLIAELNATKRRTLPVTVTAANTTASSPDVGEIHSRHSRRHRKEDNVTLCVMVIVCVFIVCQTPALLNQIFWVLFPPTERLCGRFHFYYTKLSDLLVVVNSSGTWRRTGSRRRSYRTS